MMWLSHIFSHFNIDFELLSIYTGIYNYFELVYSYYWYWIYWYGNQYNQSFRDRITTRHEDSVIGDRPTYYTGILDFELPTGISINSGVVVVWCCGVWCCVVFSAECFVLSAECFAFIVCFFHIFSIFCCVFLLFWYL